MRATINLGGTEVEFTRKTDAEGPYPYLISVGTLRVAARAGRQAGFGVGESPSLDVLLDNGERQSAALVALRAPVTVYDDADEVFFAGVVSRIGYGRIIVLTLGN